VHRVTFGMKLHHTLLAGLALGTALTACSSEQSGTAAPTSTSESAVDGTAAPSLATGIASEPAAVSKDEQGATTPASMKTLGLEGLGDLRIGKPVPNGSTWAERGAQASDACTTVTSSAYPGVYAIVLDGKVQRITVGKRSDVKLVEGIGVGASEQDAEKWFGGFRSEPHKYEAAPAKYLTAPNAGRGDSALRFEIGQDGKVSAMHVGLMPALAYVEGCA